MPNYGSCLNLITSGSNIWKVTSITPFKAELRRFLCNSLAGLHRIGSSNLTRGIPLEESYEPFLRCARWLKKGYYVLKLKNMQWWFQQCTKTRMVGLIVLKCPSWLSIRLIWCILYLSEQFLDWQILCETMLHWIESISYSLYLIMWI